MGLIGLGVDLVEVARLDAAIRRHGRRFLERVFTPAEVEYCRAGGRSAERFAARFAAKEAVMKALGTGWSGGVGFRQIEVVRDDKGAPAVRLRGEAERRAASLGVGRIAISLSHTPSSAVAFVVFEGPQG